MSKAGFVCASACCLNENGQLMVQSHEYLSLLQWVSIFDEVLLYWGETVYNNEEKWYALEANNVKFCPLFKANDSWKTKFFKIKRIAKHAQCDVFYYRMPSYESLLFYHFQDKKIPHFVEMHGNHESVIMLGNKPYVFKKALSYYILKKNIELCSNAKFAVSIGPKLVDDYVHSNIPVLVTTNHLTKECDYPVQIPMRTIHDPINILFVGNIAERKGLKYLFEALKRLKDSKIRFRMQLAGTGDIRKQLEDYATQHGFRESVEFLGQVKHGTDLYKLYQNADVFVLPSVAAEGVPRVTHEAMIFGSPVVATDIGSVAWQLQDNTGVVIKPYDVDAIYDGIIKVTFNKPFRETLIKSAFLRSKLFSWEKQSEAIKSFVYDQLN